MLSTVKLCWTPVRGAPLADKSQPGREPHEVLPQRREVAVRGVVQGVGFRPFVYRLAFEEGLAGSIGNDTDGVTIEIEGPSASLDSFLARLRSEAPPLSRIDSISVREAKATGETGFRIVASEVLGRVSTGIPADAATCPDCIRELLSPDDRRYRYPFLNCTNCGPRYTITRRIPYDRPQTSMARFTNQSSMHTINRVDQHSISVAPLTTCVDCEKLPSRSSVVGTRSGPPRNAFRFFCPVRLMNTNCRVSGLNNLGMYGDPARLTPKRFW